MTRIVSDRMGKHINSKRIRGIMKDRDLQSNVRRMKFRKEVYAARRAMRGNVPADLVKRRFFAMAPLQKLAEDITYLTGACQEFCVIEILIHSLTLPPKTMENWLRASPQFLIG